MPVMRWNPSRIQKRSAFQLRSPIPTRTVRMSLPRGCFPGQGRFQAKPPAPAGRAQKQLADIGHAGPGIAKIDAEQSHGDGRRVLAQNEIVQAI